MPLYEYVCKKCGHKTELIQSHGDKPLRKCPDCGGSVKKLISAPSIAFKGSGFYITDYGKGDIGGSSKKGEAGSEKGAGSGSSDKAETKSESKSESKSDSSGKSESSSKSESGSSKSDSSPKSGPSSKSDGKKGAKKS